MCGVSSSFTCSADKEIAWFGNWLRWHDLKGRFSRSSCLELIPSQQRLYKITLPSCHSHENSQRMLKRGTTSPTLQGAAAGGGINICAAQTAVWLKIQQNVPSAELHVWMHPQSPFTRHASNPTGRAAAVYPPPSTRESALTFDRWNELQKPPHSFAGEVTHCESLQIIQRLSGNNESSLRFMHLL